MSDSVHFDAETFPRFAEGLSNWGRWGPDDELGTLNYITPEKVVAASRLVRSGTVIELGISLDRDGPQDGAPRRFNPIHFMNALPRDDLREGGAGIADDVLVLPLQAGTQWDSLAHVAYRGVLYNDRSADRVTVHGAETNSIRAISNRVATRGVLADVARHLGVDSLEPGYAIMIADLEGALAAASVDVGEGDALLVRTGFLPHCRERNWDGYRDAAPGLGVDTAAWIHERRLAAVATDTVAVEVKPSMVDGVLFPFHIVAIPFMGLLLGEIFDLERLATECAADGVYEFFFIAPPLPITGAVGSPVNPYAVR